MSGRSISELTFACFLSACCCPPVIVQQPSAAGPTPPSSVASGGGGPGGTRTTIVGNCVQVTGTSGGVPVAYCYYTKVYPGCTTDFSDCQNQTGVCQLPPTVPDPPPC
jgi:hypothetical protein